MLRMMRLCAIALTTIVCQLSLALADNHFGVPDDYPGLAPDGLQLNHVSLLQAKHAITYYYKLNGHWPQSWRNVTESGLFTAALLCPFGNTIDPDDRLIDFQYDLQFNYKGADESPELIYVFGGDGRHLYHQRFDDSLGTFAAALYKAKSRATSSDQLMNALEIHADNPDWLRTIAIGCTMNRVLADAWLMRGGEIKTWDDFVNSGFFTQRPDSLNPLTGRPWAVDGGLGSLVWRDSQGPQHVPSLALIDPASGAIIPLLQ